MYVDSKTLRDLEWSTILKHLAQHSCSELGKDLCFNLLPDNDEEVVKEALRQTTEAKNMLQMALNPPFGSMFNISLQLQKAEIASTLENKDFVKIGSTLVTAKKLKEFFEKQSEQYPEIYQISSLLMDHNRLIDTIYKCFDTAGNMLDTASPLLKQLRDSLRDQTSNLKDRLNALLHSESTLKFLQEPVFTIRNDRYVLPVKAEFKSNVPGIVHDSSASGVTIFIEPRSIVDLNNKLKETELKIDHEIQRILIELTMLVAQNAQNIYITLDILAKLDLLFAKARYSITLDAGEPEINNDKLINLKRVRHPILLTTLDKVIPNTIELGEKYSTLVITGANTGGKTVLLKTIGLCVLMAGAGMHIPADAGSSVYLFSSVFADIVNEQSIEQNLSNFSAHMTNIINVVNKSDDESLILLDELGAGTDPTEGTALAQSILESLNGRGSITVITTHYGGLKTLAYFIDGFVNASVEFNVETLKPTFRLMIGIPGKSNAMTIAKNLGLNDEIVARAQDIYTSSVDNFSLLLDDMQKVQQETINQLKQAQEKHQLAEQMKDQYEKDIEKFNSTQLKNLNSFKRNLNTELSMAKREVMQILDQLKLEKTEKSSKQAHAKLSEVDYNTRQLIDKYKEEIKPQKESPPINWNNIKLGDKVFLKELGQEAILVSLPDDNNRVVVQMGLIKSTVKTTDLQVSKEAGFENFSPSFKEHSAHSKSLTNRTISTTCDLRGKTVDEGLFELEYYLDQAALSNISPVYIIHGYGSGALRKAVREYLKESPYVKKFRPGELGEGSDGVSVVELK